MTTTRQITKDDLSRGKTFWSRQVQILNSRFRRTTGDANLQRICDLIGFCHQVREACPTYSPCSRECVVAPLNA